MPPPSSSTPTRRCTPRSRPARTPTASTPPATSRPPTHPPRRAPRRSPRRIVVPAHAGTHKKTGPRVRGGDAGGLLVLDEVLHALEEIKLVQRLHDVVVRAERAPARRVAIAAEARHHHHGQRPGARIRPDA